MRGKKESGDGGSPRAYHDKNRQESPPAKTGGRLIEVNGRQKYKKVQKLQPRYAMLELSSVQSGPVLAPKTPGSIGFAKQNKRRGKQSVSIMPWSSSSSY